MFDVFKRSWYITKLSFSVILKDKELILFPMLAGIFSTIFMVLMALPSLIPLLFEKAGIESVSTILGAISIFIIYLGLAFIATFFNVCVVYTTKIRFEGGNATFMESLQFAISKIHLIFAWSMVAATVGLILRLLDHLAEKMGGIGEIILRIINSFLGLIWSIVTIFVVPSMVYNDCGPIDAIKSSIEVIKRTWGESLIRHYGLGFVQGVIGFFGSLIFIALIVLLFVIAGPIGAGIAIALLVLFHVGVILIFTVANSIFNTALYVYANTGNVPGGFSQEVLQNAFKRK